MSLAVVCVESAAIGLGSGKSISVVRGEIYAYDHPAVVANWILFVDWPASEADIAERRRIIDLIASNRNAGLLLE